MTLQALPGEAGVLILETSRIGGLILAAPLPWKESPVRVRAVLVFALAFVAHGLPRPDRAPFSFAELVAATPTEVLIGVAMGMVVRIALAAADVAAEAMGPLIGLGVPAVFDPMTLTNVTEMTRFLGTLIMLLAVLVGVHRVVIGSVLASFRVLPPGAVADPSLAAIPLWEMAGVAIGLGFRIALPVVAVLLMTHIALAFVSRAAPAMQIFSIGFAASLLVGSAIFLATMTDQAAGMAADLSAVGERVQTVLAAMVRR